MASLEGERPEGCEEQTSTMCEICHRPEGESEETFIRRLEESTKPTETTTPGMIASMTLAFDYSMQPDMRESIEEWRARGVCVPYPIQ